MRLSDARATVIRFPGASPKKSSYDTSHLVKHPKKKEARIYDYVDRQVPLLVRMFEKRLRGYRAIGYSSDNAPLIPKGEQLG